MAYQILHRNEHNILETIWEGKASVADLFMVIRKNLSLSKEHGAHLFLVDCTAMIDDTEKVFENYEVASFMARLIPDIPHRFRDAIIMPPGDVAKANFRFFETVARNRGLNVRVFSTQAEALGWLLAK